MQRFNNFEGGTDGVAISAANSGGASGDAFQAISSSPVPKYTNVQALDTLSYSVVNAAATTGVDWTWTSITTTMWFRVYLYLSALPTGANMNFLRVMTDTAGSRCAEFIVKLSNGAIEGLNAAATGTGTAGTISVTLNQWVRVEMRVFPSATVGEIEWRLYNDPNSTSITESKSASGLVLGSDIEGCKVGVFAGVPTAPFTAYFDNLAVSDVTWLGPSVSDPTIRSQFLDYDYSR